MSDWGVRGRPGRYQARRRRSPWQYVAIALALLLVAVVGFVAATAMLGSPAPTPLPPGTPVAGATASGHATPSVEVTPTPGPSATADGSPTPTASPSGPTPGPTNATPKPTRTPGGTPTAGPTATPTAAATESQYVTSGGRAGKQVALTFDFGGRVGDALAIVDYLIAHDIHASVFITGAQLDGSTEGPQVLDRICSRTSQFALGNHSYYHVDFDAVPVATMRSELSKTEAAFAKHCNRSPRPFFRPPDGAMGGYGTTVYHRILSTVGAAGYSRTVAWDVDTLDWSTATTTQNIVDYVEKGRAGNPGARNGSIVLMHLGGYHTLEALPTVVAYLQGKGFELVTLHELLGV